MKIIPQMIFTLIILVALAVVGYIGLNNRETSQDRQIKALLDTVTLYKTKDGKNAATIRVLEGSKTEVLEILEKQDKRIAEIIKNTKGLRTYTKHSVETRIDTVVKVDTLITADQGREFYLSKHLDNEYYKADITVKGEEMKLGLKVYNNFDYILRDKPPTGLFKFLKPTTYVVEAINLNQFTETKDLKSIQITPKDRTVRKVTIGIIIGAAAALFLN